MTFPTAPVAKTEINLGAWTDATTYVYQRNPISITRGRQNESATNTPSQATFTVNNRDGRWTIRNPVGAWYGQLLQSTPIRFSMPSSLAGINCYLRMETDNLSYASAPDTASLQITSGTLSARIDCKITDWSQGYLLLGKWGTTAQAWAILTNLDGTLAFAHYDGTLARINNSTLPLPYFGQRIAIRVDYNISAQTVTWYTAPTMSGSWTQLGGVLSTGATVQSAGTGQAVQVGGTVATMAPALNQPGMFGEVYEAQIYSTASLVADPVFTSQTPGATSFTDAQSNTWTLHGTSELSGRLYRFHGELSSLPKAADPSATDVYSDATASGITQRMSQQTSQSASAMTRAYQRLSSSFQLAGYWPCEDAKNIGGQLASGIGGTAGTATPQVNLASNSVFASSGAIPVLNGGQMSFTPGTGATWTDNDIEFDFAVPAGDDTNGSLVCRIFTQGTVQHMDLIYNTGGVLTLTGYNADGSQNFTSGPQSFSLAVLEAARVKVALTASGAAWFLQTVVPGAATGNSATGSFTGTIGAVTLLNFGGGGLIGSAVGQVSVQGVSSNLFLLGNPLNAWFGETAGARYARLCKEEGIACRLIGPPNKSQAMGNQTAQTVQQLLQEIETTDQGLQFEPRQVLGLGYVTNWGLCQQAVAATASYSSAQVAAAFRPQSDNQLLVNDVTMTSSDGSAARQVLTSGPMSLSSPPNGAGRFDTQVTVNPQSDALQLAGLTSWYLHARSVDDDRYPAIPFDMARTETPNTIPLLDVGSYLQITGTPSWVPPGPVKQLCAGFTEILGPFAIWTVAVNGIPETPYEVGVVGDAVYGHADTGGSQLTAPLTSAATSASVLTTSGPAWTTAGGDFPFDIRMGGEVATVTNITAGSFGACHVGAFLDPASMGVADFTAALAQWTGLGLASPAAVRYYKGNSDFTYDTNLSEIITAGKKVCLTLRPAFSPPSSADLASLNTLLTTMQSNSAVADIALWHEPFFEGLSVAQYQAMIAYYGPTVRKFFPLVFVTSVQSVQNDNENAYYPGDAQVDKCATDFYCWDFIGPGYTLDLAAAPANLASPPKPFGLWEMGVSTDTKIGQSSTQATSYFNYITTYFQNRAAAGLANADLLYFNAGEKNLLTANDSGFETSFNGIWTGNAFNGTAVQSAAQAHTGTKSALVTANGAGSAGFGTAAGGSAFAVTGGVTYTFSAWFRANTTTRACQAGGNWYNGASFLSSAFPGSTTDSNTGWTLEAETLVAPANATNLQFALQATGPPANGEIHYVDDVVFAVQSIDSSVMGFAFGSSPTSDFRIAMWTSLHTALDNTSVPQTFTLTRSVNGVVKAQNAAADVRLAHPMIVALGS